VRVDYASCHPTNRRAAKLALASALLVLIPIIGLLTKSNTVVLLGISLAPIAGIAIATLGIIIGRQQIVCVFWCALAIEAHFISAFFGWLILVHGVC